MEQKNTITHKSKNLFLHDKTCDKRNNMNRLYRFYFHCFEIEFTRK